MLKHIIFAILCLITSLRAEVPSLHAGEVYHVFLLAGQSNAEGLNFEASSFHRGEQGRLPLKKEPADEKVILIGGGDVFKAESALTTLMARGETYGPEIGLGRELVAGGVPNVVIVKLAKGGTSMRQWLKDSPHDVMWGDQTAHLYETLVARTHYAIAQLKARDGGTATVKLRGLFWMQGEADAFHSEALLYPERLHQFVSDLRKDLNAPDLPFIAGRTAITQPKKDDGLDLIRTAQMQVTDGLHPKYSLQHAAWVSVDDIAQSPKSSTVDGVKLPMGGLIDPQHFTPEAYAIFGARLAKKWLQL